MTNGMFDTRAEQVRFLAANFLKDRLTRSQRRRLADLLEEAALVGVIAKRQRILDLLPRIHPLRDQICDVSVDDVLRLSLSGRT